MPHVILTIEGLLTLFEVLDKLAWLQHKPHFFLVDLLVLFIATPSALVLALAFSLAARLVFLL